MTKAYRSWEERRRIVRAIISESSPPSVASFDLSESEEAYFRIRANRLIDQLARRSSTFKAYYKLRPSQPFLYVLGLTAVVVAFGLASGLYLYFKQREDFHIYPLLGACATLTVAAIGWCVAGWIAHRNAVRQNTTNIIFARFSQTAFMDSLHRFHKEFGVDALKTVSGDKVRALRARDDEGQKATEAVNYLLNYYEFIAGGVLRGDLDALIVRDNLRGVICYYYDMCRPLIREGNQRNPKAFANLIKLRTHYREP